MREQDALWHAILQAPQDDEPRLVYADWLEEHEQAERAEFIRVQIELARGHSTAAVQHRLLQRERRLLREHELTWTAPLHGLVRRARFRRGFPECVTVTADDFLARADDLFRLAPVQHLILIDVHGRAAELVKSPHLGRAPTLEFRTFGDVGALVRSRHLEKVTGLILRFGDVEDDDARALAGARTLPALTALDLYRCGLTPAGIGTLATSPRLAGLTDLVLGGNTDEGDSVAEVLTSPDFRLSRLERLHLSYCRVSDSGAKTLAAAPALASLRALDLSFNDIGSAGARALADSPHLKGLTHLSLYGNPLRRARRMLSERLGARLRV
ncbi:MAG: TIGR02996 domain-containing protein [Gemmataceae bacterium]|nr:TIGR02996 domain-containing protein [Gemmataceae bacterium]